MKKKSDKVVRFIEGMHKYITTDPQFRRDTRNKQENEVQAEIRPLIIGYLQKYFKKAGYKDSVAKANSSFYWEGQEGEYGRERQPIFASRNYPDFIIREPYLMAIEYKQSASGSAIKQGIGQSMMHTLCKEFDYVYFLFHDESKKKMIEASINKDTEKFVIDKMWQDFNVFVKFI